MTPKTRIIPIFVPHLGCPHQCVFCDQRTISGSAKAPDGAETERTIMAALETTEPDCPVEIAFYGGSFTAVPVSLQTELLDAAQRCAGRRCGVTIRFSTRPDCVSRAVLRRLQDYSISTIELGVQSMCAPVLEQSGRGHTPQDAVRAAALVREAGYRLILQMMTGLCGDTPSRSLYTAGALAALQPDGVRIYPTVVVRGTPLFRMWQAGFYRPQTVEEAVALCARIVPVFQKRNIPVIRLGLHPTEALSAGEAAAGAYHPALGELVYGRLFREDAERQIREGRMDGAAVEILVPPGRASFMAGQKRCNTLYLQQTFGLRRIVIRENAGSGGVTVKMIAK